MFLSCRPFVVNTTFSTGFVGVEVTSVSWLGQLTVLSPFVVNTIFSTGFVGVEVTSVSWLGQLTVGVKITDLTTETTVRWEDGGK